MSCHKDIMSHGNVMSQGYHVTRYTMPCHTVHHVTQYIMPCRTAHLVTVQHVTVQHATSHSTACSVSNCTPCHCRAFCHTVQQILVRPVNVYPSMHHSLAVGHGKLSLAGDATSISFCCDKTFVTTNICRDKSMLVEKKT